MMGLKEVWLRVKVLDWFNRTARFRDVDRFTLSLDSRLLSYTSHSFELTRFDRVACVTQLMFERTDCTGQQAR